MMGGLSVLAWVLIWVAIVVVVQVVQEDWREYIAKAPRPRNNGVGAPCTQCGHLEDEHGLGGDWCRFCPCTGYAPMRHTS